MCCWESLDALDRSGGACGRCNLEGSHSMGVSSDGQEKVSLEPSGEFLVLFRVDGKGVGRIRSFSADCELDAGERPFIWLTGIDPRESLDWLSGFVEERREGDEEDLTQSAIMAIAMHAGRPADLLLAKLTTAAHPSSVREHAIFWMGQARGRAGYEVVRMIARDDASTEIRRKGIFALSQSPVPEATEDLIRFAHGDRETEVRGEALFWLGQKAGERAVRALADAIDNDPEVEVKKKAVFGLSQLAPDVGVPLLIGIAKTHRSPEVRREAIFWLGQSGDPRALDLIEEILRS
jgi:HEAT repeat protein